MVTFAVSPFEVYTGGKCHGTRAALSLRSRPGCAPSKNHRLRSAMKTKLEKFKQSDESLAVSKETVKQ